MHIVHVYFNVKPDKIERFKEISLINAKNSLNEPGVLEFDVLQQQDDPSKFVFNEIYKTPDDQLKHRETAHFRAWRLEVNHLTVEPYNPVKYNKV